MAGCSKRAGSYLSSLSFINKLKIIKYSSVTEFSKPLTKQPPYIDKIRTKTNRKRAQYIPTLTKRRKEK